MTLVCVVCATTYDRDDAPDRCAECDGKLIDSRVRYEREQEEAWAVECAWEAYHAGRIELPAVTPNFLRIKQAG